MTTCPQCHKKTRQTRMGFSWRAGRRIQRWRCNHCGQTYLGSIQGNSPSSIYKETWAQLYNAFGERMQDEELELMNAVLQGIKLDYEEQQDVNKTKKNT